jgi:Mn2+/Fe2+ NRAMP family transporter
MLPALRRRRAPRALTACGGAGLCCRSKRNRRADRRLVCRPAHLATGQPGALIVSAQILSSVITPLFLTHILVLSNKHTVQGTPVNGRTFNVPATMSVAVNVILSVVVLIQTVVPS